MYAAIRRYQLDPKYSDEVIRQIVENFVPLVGESEGLLGYYVLDAEDGAFATTTICENQAEVEESSWSSPRERERKRERRTST